MCIRDRYWTVLHLSSSNRPAQPAIASAGVAILVPECTEVLGRSADRADRRRPREAGYHGNRHPLSSTGARVRPDDRLEPAAFVPLRSRARAALEAAWERATAAGALPHVAAIERPAIEIERPANPEHGDLSSNLAMKLARPCRMAPLRICLLYTS